MKFQVIVLVSFFVMFYVLVDDQGGLKQDVVLLLFYVIEDGYCGIDDVKKMIVDFVKIMYDGVLVLLCGNLIFYKGEDCYVFCDKSGEINVVIFVVVFDG